MAPLGSSNSARIGTKSEQVIADLSPDAANKTVRIDRASTRPLTSRAMAVREIIILPDKRLRLMSEPVKKIDADIRKLVDDMFETMYDAPGIGLAAIQVGVPKRVSPWIWRRRRSEHEPRVFINPEISGPRRSKAIYEEGCLSIPEFYEEVERPAR